MPDPDLAVYFTNVDGWFTTVLVDLKWHTRGADPDRPIWVEVGVPLRTAGADGLPEGGEMRALEMLDGPFQAAMERAAGAVLVGAMTSRGWRRWFFYARSDNVEAAARDAFEGDSSYQPQWRSENDPAWRNYRERLYPTPDQLRWINDLRVILALGKHGDDGRRRRRVDHWAYFDDRGSAERFANWCGGNGFTLDGEDQPKAFEGKFGVQFFHIGPATIEVINERTVAADRAARQFGGEYDGWETMVLRRPWWRFWG